MKFHILTCEKCGFFRMGVRDGDIIEWFGWMPGNLTTRCNVDIEEEDTVEECSYCLVKRKRLESLRIQAGKVH